MQTRENALNDWVKTQFNSSSFEMKLLAGDASFRRYWRVTTPEQSFVLMDAPPEKESIDAFIDIDKALKKINIHAPAIFAINRTLGTLLLEDFGDTQLLSELNTNTFETFYQGAMEILATLQRCHPQNFNLPAFDKVHMIKEMQLFIDWYCKRHLGLNLPPSTEAIILNAFEWISHELSQVPQVFIHRDYHSRNLMCLEGYGLDSLGVLDFQDAMQGPIGYDLVSLLKDCYISWPKEKVVNLVKYFHEHFDTQGLNFEDFYRAFELCGIQRHLKVLGIFCRLNYRDGKEGYLKDLPLTLSYLRHALRGVDELKLFAEFIEENMPCTENLPSF